MDQSYSENDLSMSPSQILERLQMLRHLQLLQRGKLLKQQLQYDSPELIETITEVVSHFSNETSYNTFRSILQSSQETEMSARAETNGDGSSQSRNVQDLLGVTLLNESQVSECEVDLNTSTNNRQVQLSPDIKIPNKHIALDEIPILSPKKDFETMIKQTLQSENLNDTNSLRTAVPLKLTENKAVRKPFLKRGEGMTRFGIKKKDLVIQNTKSLPWKQGIINKKIIAKSNSSTAKSKNPSIQNVQHASETAKIHVMEPLCTQSIDQKTLTIKTSPLTQLQKTLTVKTSPLKQLIGDQIQSAKISNIDLSSMNCKTAEVRKEKASILKNKGKTWAAVLSKEQNDFLRQLKQSSYYKNFPSPCKSIVSDTSCDDHYIRSKHEKETAEQNLFELLESKVTNDSFNLENSFFNRFLQKNVIDESGESTPLILKKCLKNNPKLTHISPEMVENSLENSSRDIETCNSECTECVDTCSSVSSCCSCRTVTQNENSQTLNEQKKEVDNEKVLLLNNKKYKNEDKCQNDSGINMNVNIVEMNAKLVATSELLKDRLKELEDEIETFRNENLNLTKIREELDVERQKFYEEKREFEQKFNEEKILSEYYLAEEKEKLQKQKLMYDRYVRDIRGRLNKKEKDEIANLKKEIQDLKEEIKIKDAKSTSHIARLRNQIKIFEKDKKQLEYEIEKLKKENRRIHHSNEINKRMTNLKYLENINKKLSDLSTKDSKVKVVVDPDMKYKSLGMERGNKNKTSPLQTKMRKRAKSVPNLNVTSRYAKYFSQKDSLSDMEKQNTYNIEMPTSNNSEYSDNEIADDIDVVETIRDTTISDSDEESHLERIYKERFKCESSKNRTDEANNSLIGPDSKARQSLNRNTSDFFITKSRNSTLRHSNASISDSFSPPSILSNRFSNESRIQNTSKDSGNCEISLNEVTNTNKSPSSFVSNESLHSRKSTALTNKDLYCDTRLLPSPEPTSSRSSISKTNLNPTEFLKTDGSKELRFPNGNIKFISADGKYTKFVYYNGDIKENFYNEGRIKYFYAETKTYHTTHADGLEVLEFPDGQIEKRYKDGSSEIRLPNGSVRYFDPKNEHVREEWRFPDGASLIVAANGEQRIKFTNGQVEVHANDHKRREFPDGTVKLVYNDGTSETRYASGRVRIKDKHGNLIMDSAPG